MKKLLSFLLVLSLLATGICLTASAEAVLTGTVSGFLSYGNVILSLTMEDVKASGIEHGDIVTVDIGGQKYDMLVAYEWDGLRRGELVFYVSDIDVMLTVPYGSFAFLSGIGVCTDDGTFTWAEGVEQPMPVTVTLKAKWGQTRDGYTLGTLSMLNFSEDQFMEHYNVINSFLTYMRVQGYTESKETIPVLLNIGKVVFYDTLNDMMNALNAGYIDAAVVNESVGNYIVSLNSDLKISGSISQIPDQDTFAESLYAAITDEFSFMLREGSEDLRDRMNQALEAMTADGTLDKLVEEYITNIKMEEVKSVDFPQFDEAETITVAVTGDLPPMDYVNADGTPAGFNTAVLSELANRMRVNIELKPVASSGRALALSTVADVVFWVRNHNYLYHVAEDPSIAESQELKPLQTLTLAAMDGIRSENYILSVADSDIPENTILTKPYYIDPIVLLVR